MSQTNPTRLSVHLAGLNCRCPTSPSPIHRRATAPMAKAPHIVQVMTAKDGALAALVYDNGRMFIYDRAHAPTPQPTPRRATGPRSAIPKQRSKPNLRNHETAFRHHRGIAGGRHVGARRGCRRPQPGHRRPSGVHGSGSRSGRQLVSVMTTTAAGVIATFVPQQAA